MAKKTLGQVFFRVKTYRKQTSLVGLIQGIDDQLRTPFISTCIGVCLTGVTQWADPWPGHCS